MNQPLNLAEFTPLPHNPAYMVRADGRVLSLKKQQPTLLAEQRSLFGPTSWRVRIAAKDYRIRDIVLLLHGTASEFEERAWEWIEDSKPEEYQ